MIFITCVVIFWNPTIFKTIKNNYFWCPSVWIVNDFVQTKHSESSPNCVTKAITSLSPEIKLIYQTKKLEQNLPKLKALFYYKNIRWVVIQIMTQLYKEKNVCRQCVRDEFLMQKYALAMIHIIDIVIYYMKPWFCCLVYVLSFK